MLSAGGAPDPDAEVRLESGRELERLRGRVLLLERRLELVEVALTSRERGWVPGFVRFLVGRR